MNDESPQAEVGAVADPRFRDEGDGSHDFRAQPGTEEEDEREPGQDRPAAENDPELESTFQAAVEEGTLRLRRNLPTLLATGLVGGIDLSIGVMALIVVEHETGSHLLGSLAFTIGFIALTLARGELFTENFLVPVTAIIAHQARVRELVRLWAGTMLMNLVGGWLVMGLFVTSMPELGSTAIKVGEVYPELGIGWRSFALALLGGAVITVMTWMERNCETQGPRVVAAIAASFLLAAVPLNHVIVSSHEMFAALHVGAPFGYLDYLGAMSWSMVGNTIGGLLLVTVVRLVQVGRGPIEQARRTPFRRLHPGADDDGDAERAHAE
ncbi:MAG: formate/nitrite transporter family protein [Actinobacteria bacterium]|nr:formate/nitrite transporter family protein [Actinomycetota bacterium]